MAWSSTKLYERAITDYRIQHPNEERLYERMTIPEAISLQNAIERRGGTSYGSVVVRTQRTATRAYDKGVKESYIEPSERGILPFLDLLKAEDAMQVKAFNYIPVSFLTGEEARESELRELQKKETRQTLGL